MSPRANEPEGRPPANPRPSAPRVPPAFFLMTPQGRQPLSAKLQKLLPLFWTGMLISCELIGHQGDSERFPSCLRNTNFSQKQNSEEKHSLGCSEQPPQAAQAAELGGGTTCPQLLALEQDTAAQRSLWGQALWTHVCRKLGKQGLKIQHRQKPRHGQGLLPARSWYLLAQQVSPQQPSRWQASPRQASPRQVSPRQLSPKQVSPGPAGVSWSAPTWGESCS